MALAAITTAEVSGTTAKELSDAEVMAVLGKEVRKRAEAAEAFAGAGRPEQAAKEEAEAAVLTAYLPVPLTDDEIADLVGKAVADVAASTGAPVTMRQMGVGDQAGAGGRGGSGRRFPDLGGGEGGVGLTLGWSCALWVHRTARCGLSTRLTCGVDPAVRPQRRCGRLGSRPHRRPRFPEAWK